MNAEILNQLKDVHLPLSPSWWPLASGFYILFILIIFVLVLILFYIRKQKPIWRLRNNINLELVLIEKNYLQNNNTSMLQNNLVGLIRRVNINNTKQDIKACAEKLFLKSDETTEFIGLLELDRFKKTTDASPLRLLELAKKKFKKCKL